MANGESIESCAARHPERRAELVPLLKTAAMTVNAATAVSYDPAAKQRGLRRLMEAAGRKRSARSGVFSWLRWKPALAVGLSAAVLMTATAWGTTMASSESVPGDTLYWVKRTKESISLMIPQSDMSRAERHVGLAVERGEEMGKLVIRGRYSDAERHVLQVEYHISMTAGTVGIHGPTSMEMPAINVKIIDRRTVTHLHARISRDRERLYVGLMQVREELPPDAAPSVRHAQAPVGAAVPHNARYPERAGLADMGPDLGRRAGVGSGYRPTALTLGPVRPLLCQPPP